MGEKKKIRVMLKTTIDDGESKEYNKISEIGDLFQSEKRDVLTFIEKTEDNEEIKNFITIQESRVTVKRSGYVTMNQTFQENRITENIYRHPHGAIHMETFTRNIDYRMNSNHTKGQLFIDYTVKLNGQDERKHKLELIYAEEDSK